jgi:hypothetical protein
MYPTGDGLVLGLAIFSSDIHSPTLDTNSPSVYYPRSSKIPS